MGRTGRVILLILLLLTAAYFSFDHEPESTGPPPPGRAEPPPGKSDPALPPGAGDPVVEPEDDLTREETARITAELASEEPPPASVSGIKPGELVDFWLRCLSVKDDRNLRTETIEAVKQALASADPVEVKAALQVVPRLVPLGVDAAALRALVVPHLGSEDATVRAMAVLAFHRLSGEEVDREPLFARTRDSSESVRITLAEVISDHPGPRLTDRGGRCAPRDPGHGRPEVPLDGLGGDHAEEPPAPARGADPGPCPGPVAPPSDFDEGPGRR